MVCGVRNDLNAQASRLRIPRCIGKVVFDGNDTTLQGAHRAIIGMDGMCTRVPRLAKIICRVRRSGRHRGTGLCQAVELVLNATCGVVTVCWTREFAAYWLKSYSSLWQTAAVQVNDLIILHARRTGWTRSESRSDYIGTAHQNEIPPQQTSKHTRILQRVRNIIGKYVRNMWRVKWP